MPRACGGLRLVETLSAFIGSIAANETTADRPAFTYARDASTGALTVTLTSGAAPEHVYLRHVQTLSGERRDFRWVRIVNETTGDKCSLPGIKLKHKVEGGGNCLQPMIWRKSTLSPTKEAMHSMEDPQLMAGGGGGKVFTGTPPKPKEGHFTGYYIELIYPRTDAGGQLKISTPGFVWPDTLPFADCALRKGAPNECTGDLV